MRREKGLKTGNGIVMELLNVWLVSSWEVGGKKKSGSEWELNMQSGTEK